MMNGEYQMQVLTTMLLPYSVLKVQERVSHFEDCVFSSTHNYTRYSLK